MSSGLYKPLPSSLNPLFGTRSKKVVHSLTRDKKLRQTAPLLSVRS